MAQHTQAAHIMGEFRAALDGIKRHDAHMVWMFWSYLLLGEEHRCAARLQLERLFDVERYHGASLLEWIDWAQQGFLPLVRRLEHEEARDPGLAIEEARGCAANFLAAWLWQCMLNRHEEYAEADLHVSLGLGQERALVMEWDFRASPVGRHVLLVSSSLARGQLNTHAALAGFPGLPEHCRWPTMRGVGGVDFPC